MIACGTLFFRIQFLRHIRDFFGLVFKIDVQQMQTETAGDDTADEDHELKLGGDKVILTCTGVGYRNLSKVVL
jgi:RNA 3'-terminal phosphate cyclase-like protein